jgi:hypothetical protein
MTTVLQIVNGAAEKIGVKEAESALEADDFQVILDELNDMLFEWADLGLTPAFTYVQYSTDTVNISRNAVSAVKNNLAIRIAPSFERIVTQALAKIATDSLEALRTSTVYIGDVAYPDSMPTGSGNDCSTNRRFFSQNKTENF